MAKNIKELGLPKHPDFDEIQKVATDPQATVDALSDINAFVQQFANPDLPQENATMEENGGDFDLSGLDLGEAPTGDVSSDMAALLAGEGDAGEVSNDDAELARLLGVEPDPAPASPLAVEPEAEVEAEVEPDPEPVGAVGPLENVEAESEAQADEVAAAAGQVEAEDHSLSLTVNDALDMIDSSVEGTENMMTPPKPEGFEDPEDDFKTPSELMNVDPEATAEPSDSDDFLKNLLDHKPGLPENLVTDYEAMDPSDAIATAEAVEAHQKDESDRESAETDFSKAKSALEAWNQDDDDVDGDGWKDESAWLADDEPETADQGELDANQAEAIVEPIPMAAPAENTAPEAANENAPTSSSKKKMLAGVAVAALCAIGVVSAALFGGSGPTQNVVEPVTLATPIEVPSVNEAPSEPASLFDDAAFDEMMPESFASDDLLLADTDVTVEVDEDVLAAYATKEDTASSIAEVKAAIDLLHQRAIDQEATDATFSAQLEQLGQKLIDLAQETEADIQVVSDLAPEILIIQNRQEGSDAAIVDLSKRVARMEATDPADRVDMQRQFDELHRRQQDQARQMSYIARELIAMKSNAANPAMATSGTVGAGSVFLSEVTASPVATARKACEYPSGPIEKGMILDGFEDYGPVVEVWLDQGGKKLIIFENGAPVCQ